jgi:HPt (histidine-containing phosphotransfer) domain-containing protein
MKPDAPDSPILDLDHLRRQTFGDVALERELLALFNEQCTRLLPVISGADPSGDRAVAVHTFKGSARAIGAWRVASLAELLEAALDEGEQSATRLVPAFTAALDLTRAAVAERCCLGGGESAVPPLAIPSGLP